MSNNLQNNAEFQELSSEFPQYLVIKRSIFAYSVMLSVLKDGFVELSENETQEDIDKVILETEKIVSDLSDNLEKLNEKLENARNFLLNIEEPLQINEIARLGTTDLLTILCFNEKLLKNLNELLVERIREEIPTYTGHFFLDDIAGRVDEINDEPVFSLLGSSDEPFGDIDLTTVSEYFAALLPNAKAYFNASYNNIKEKPKDIRVDFLSVLVENGKVEMVYIDSVDTEKEETV